MYLLGLVTQYFVGINQQVYIFINVVYVTKYIKTEVLYLKEIINTVNYDWHYMYSNTKTEYLLSISKNISCYYIDVYHLYMKGRVNLLFNLIELK